MDGSRDSRGILNAYLARLQLDDSERQRLLASAAVDRDITQSLSRLHRQLVSTSGGDADNPSWNSIGARLRIALRSPRGKRGTPRRRNRGT